MAKSNGTLEIKQVEIEKLQEAVYNPRLITEKDKQELKDSIERFGMVEPIVINMHKDREYVVIGGHQRLNVCKSLGYKKIPCSVRNLDLEQEKELNIRLNKNSGDWDWVKLEANYEVKDLVDWGFNSYQFNTIHFEESSSTDELSQDVVTPKIPNEFLALEIMMTAEQKKDIMIKINEVKKEHNCSNGDALHKIVMNE